MQHNLEQLGSSGFQDLAAALTIATFGPRIQVLGSGRDGGRDMYCNGVLVWSASDQVPAEVWDGYTVFQVKQKERLEARPADNAAWLWTQVRAELEKWADPTNLGRNPVPNHLVIITNVPLTPTPHTGGLAMLHKNIAEYIEALDDSKRDVDASSTAARVAKRTRMARLKAWRIWDGNQLDALLTTHDSVRKGFSAFLTAADVFAHLGQFTDQLPLQELETGLRKHARASLINDHWLYFDEAGDADTAGTPIEKVVVDLPVTVGEAGQRHSAIRYILERGERVLNPRLGLFPGPRHIVVAGAPGNGKTTISKFLVQAYRAALLNGGQDLSADHQAVIEGTRAALQRFGTDLPKHRRWPIRIDLAEYVEEGGLTEDSTLLRWISHKVSKRLVLGKVTPRALDSWQKQWPWLLVLDGLDEVTEPTVRKRLIEQITEFVTEADADKCDLLAVVTTRPMGYTENIAPTQFERIDMAQLSVTQAVEYGVRAVRVRLKGDPDRVERVERHLQKAGDNEALRHLMQTPLQVLIMSIIVESSGQLSPDRYSLFWGYYETVFKRERQKPGPFSRLLQENSPHILTLHQRVGFQLQVRSETGDGAAAMMTREELRDLTWQVLNDAGFKPSGADADLLDRFITSATHRLVLLAPRGDEGLGFDVRTLQELMAAMYLTTGPFESVLSRLAQAAPSPHWRNTWVFAAGRVFAEPQAHQHDALVELVENVDMNASQRLGAICPIGPQLALDLVDDGMAASHPRFHDRLVGHGLRVLQQPPPVDPLAVARILVRAANGSDRVDTMITKGLREALSGDDVARSTATAVQSRIDSAATDVGAGLEARALRAVRAHKTLPQASQRDLAAALREFDSTLTEWPEDEATAAKLKAAAEAIRRLLDASSPTAEPESIVNALQDASASLILEMAIEHVVPVAPQIVAGLRDLILPSVYRQPIGDELR
ncbi:hypothetical protein GCM10009789_82950 [Kribbella sancticallisti]|uniref:NACHT domain-containing protein n=1 Tax=Kribbella sancticallisti TaxID=460087 RepID=A0ABP4QPG6_9ACTN